MSMLPDFWGDHAFLNAVTLLALFIASSVAIGFAADLIFGRGAGR